MYVNISICQRCHEPPLYESSHQYITHSPRERMYVHLVLLIINVISITLRPFITPTTYPQKGYVSLATTNALWSSVTQ